MHTAYMNSCTTMASVPNGHSGAVKLQRVGQKGPTAGSVLCSKHYELHNYITEEVWYHDTVGIPAKKRLKPNAIPTIFPKPDGDNSQPTSYTFAKTSFEKQKAKSSKCFTQKFNDKAFNILLSWPTRSRFVRRGQAGLTSYLVYIKTKILNLKRSRD